MTITLIIKRIDTNEHDADIHTIDRDKDGNDIAGTHKTLKAGEETSLTIFDTRRVEISEI